MALPYFPRPRVYPKLLLGNKTGKTNLAIVYKDAGELRDLWYNLQKTTLKRVDGDRGGNGGRIGTISWIRD